MPTEFARQTVYPVARGRRARCVRGVRVLGVFVLISLPLSCAFCVENVVPPQAVENNTFCAQYVEQGNFQAARARCRLAIEYAPKYAEPYNLLGLIEYHEGRPELAADYFKRAISLRNDFAEAYNNIGAIFMDERNYSAACDEFKQALEVDPGYLSARLNLGNCKFHLKDYDEARDEYLKCVELDPNACDCRLGLGSVAAVKNDPSEAKVHYQKMTEICPDNAAGFYNLCWSYMQLNRCGDAVEACMGALALDPKHREARGALTQAQSCQALEHAAIAEYLKKIRKRPGDPELHFNLGVVFYEKRLPLQALAEFLNTTKLDPKHQLAHYWAARVNDDLLRAEETVLMCKQFVDLIRDGRYPEQRAWCVSRIQELQYQ